MSYQQLPPRTFGPVPSRRFGQSLGLNTIPPKTCTYSCVYCQLGATSRLTLQREPHCDPGELAADVKAVFERLADTRQRVDYLTFVPDGEPTLDSGLSQQIDMLRPLGVPIAVITNGSLLAREDVREAAAKADRVSVKVDAVRHKSWQGVARPHGDLKLEEVLDGILQFARIYQGELHTETMLCDELNDSTTDVHPLAVFLEALDPRRSYLAVPTRPPAVAGVRAPSEDAIVQAYGIVSSSVAEVELLTGYEGDAFASTGDLEADLLAIMSVHPMRADQVEALLARSGETWDMVEWLVRQEKLREVGFAGRRFYIRPLLSR